MNKKQFLSLLLLLIVVGGLGLIVSHRDRAAWNPAGSNPGQNVLADFNVNDVAEIHIRQSQTNLVLHKKSDVWTVAERSDYPANFQQISEFILKMHDLKAVQSIDVGPSQRARLEVEEPGKGTKSGTLVEFLDAAGKPVRRFILGKSHTHQSGQAAAMGEGGWPDGRYILPALDATRVDVVSDPLSTAEPKPDPWLDKDFFKIEKPSSIALESKTATNSWKVSRDTETAEWKLDAPKPGEQLDSGKTSSFGYSLSNPSFTDVATNLVEANSNLAAGLRLTIQTFDHFTYNLAVSTNGGENYELSVKVAADLPKERTPGKEEKPEEKKKLDQSFADSRKQSEQKLKREQGYEKWVYLVSKWTLDPLLKERGQLLAEKKPEPKPRATNSPPPTFSLPK